MADTSLADVVAPTTPGLPATSNPVDAYKTPYTDAVLAPALKKLGDAGQQQRNALGTQAFAAGAYGDARHGVEAGVLDKNLASAAGDLTASVNSDAFDKAMGWLNTDLDRQTGVSEFNAGLDNQNTQNMLQFLGLGNTMNQQNISNSQSMINALLGLDQYDKGATQDQLNANYEDWAAANNYDSDQIAKVVAMLSGIPGQTSSTVSTPNNTLADILGAVAGGVTGGIFK